MATTQPIGPIVNPGSQSGVLYFVLSARDVPLRDRGLIGSTVQDPYIKWSTKDKVNPEFKPAGTTAYRQNEPNPEWHEQVFSFEWRKGVGQIWRFELMDKDLNPDDFVGYVDIDVDNYVAKGQQYSEDLLKASQGRIFIHGTQPVSLKLSAHNLPKLDPFNGLSDPYVKCYWSVGGDGPQIEFAKTKTVKNVENCEWEDPVVFAAYQPERNQYLTFQVFDDDKLPRDDKIGTAAVDVDRFLREKKTTVLKLEGKNKPEDLLPILTIKLA